MTYQRREESDAERTLRIKREAQELAAAQHRADAEGVVTGPELEAWLDSLDQDLLLPMPKLRARD